MCRAPIACLSLIALVLIALFWLSYPFVDWSRIFNVKTEIAKSEAGRRWRRWFVASPSRCRLGVAQKVQMGCRGASCRACGNAEPVLAALGLSLIGNSTSSVAAVSPGRLRWGAAGRGAV